MDTLLAHVCEDQARRQTLIKHSRNVSRLCREAGAGRHLACIAALIGLLHDFGKAAALFQRYLRGAAEHPNHAVFGARYAYKTWFRGSEAERRTALMIVFCVSGHHAGFQDALNQKGESPFLANLADSDILLYEDAKANYLSQIAKEDELNELFAKSCAEVDAFLGKASAWDCGMLARLLMSILVDSDRWDAACFEYDTCPFRDDDAIVLPWQELLARLEAHIDGMDASGEIGKIRCEVSMRCREVGGMPPDIYRLSVPTGGGKTLSSLRYALAHAGINHLRRIFYIIPFNTILDQNARDIRQALDGYPSILEHHANVVIDDDDDERQSAYRRLTERWDSDIILTSLVQFLNALFRKENSDARRMWRLADAVLIFDEIQSLPKRCMKLFEKAIRFLNHFCGCTIVLCTATQPKLDTDPAPTEIIEDAERLYERLKRVRYLPDLAPRSCAQAAEMVAEWTVAGRSTLVVVNTKAVAREIYNGVLSGLKEGAYPLIGIPDGLSDDELEAFARQADRGAILCVHLSTLMCPAHRKEVIRRIKAWQRAKRTVCCVSTALIEAGINISFPVVVRSLASLPSIIQAAGRCNRNCEAPLGDVHIWHINEENLTQLHEIRLGQAISRELIADAGESGAQLDAQETVRAYFEREMARLKQERPNWNQYPYEPWQDNLVEMLSRNARCKQAAEDRRDSPTEQLSCQLCQSFRTAGDAFMVIDKKTRGVLTPYGQGKDMIARICGAIDQQERISALRKAQQYSVELYASDYERLSREGALHPLGDTGVACLRENYYDSVLGVTGEPGELQFCGF